LPEISKIIGAEWKKLTEEQRDQWKDKAKTLKLEYDIEVFNLTEKFNGTQNKQAAPFNGTSKEA